MDVKNLLLLFLLSTVVAVPTLALAQSTPSQCSGTDSSFCALAPIPGLDQGLNATTQDVATFLNNLYTFAIGIAAILAVGMIIYGGVEYALSEAITSKSDGKKKITQALYGLVLVLAPALVFGIINPAILNLNVNFQPLKTVWGLNTGTPPPAPYTPNPFVPPPGGITDPSQIYPGFWCYQQADGKYGCGEDSQATCQTLYDRDVFDGSTPKSACKQYGTTPPKISP